MHTIIKENIETIIKICGRYNVVRLYVFGSVLEKTFSYKKSDLDFIVEMEQVSAIEKGEKLIQLWDELENLFQRNVDLLTDQPIRNPYFKAQVERTKQLIYDRSKQEILV